jgi:hypothetical protein
MEFSIKSDPDYTCLSFQLIFWSTKKKSIIIDFTGKFQKYQMNCIILEKRKSPANSFLESAAFN